MTLTSNMSWLVWHIFYIFDFEYIKKQGVTRLFYKHGLKNKSYIKYNKYNSIE
jgi:hypothetical protein